VNAVSTTRPSLVPPPAPLATRHSPLGLLFRSKLAAVGLVLLVVIVAAALLAGQLAPADPYAQELTRKLKPPAWVAGGAPENPLGTDQLGRDVLSRMLFGLRVSLLVAVVAVLISGAIGVVSGLLAGYYGGRTESLIMRLADVQLSMPLTLIAIAVIAAVGASLTNLVVVLGITQWPLYARLVRAETLALRGRDFVEAARALGAGTRRLIVGHILPNTYSSVIVAATLGVAAVVVFEAGLSFLGLGVQPPEPSLGGMLSEGREYLATAWWLGIFPGLAIMLLVLAINLLGDGLRDVFDPRAKKG
jgi:peptide/nickel transport system permease protein